jgi:peptidoglycan/LPS O-acetylase OafA/YrhL
VVRIGREATTGFDYLRVGLSLGVLFEHAIVISNPSAINWAAWYGPLSRSLVPMFFALSGYLVTGSLVRNNIPRFIALRMLRIIPALAVEVALSAVVIGLIFTNLSWSEYVSSPEFRAYFLNIFGIVHFKLPGVFGDRVLNSELWTMPYEFKCYFGLAALALIGAVRRRDLIVLAVVTFSIVMTTIGLRLPALPEGPAAPALVFVTSFLCGVAIFLYKKELPYNKYIFVACLILMYILLKSPQLIYLSAMPIAYVTIYIGLLNLPKIPFGDLSYGIYVFHYPIARTAFEISGGAISWAPLFLITLVGAVGFALASWKLIEAPALSQKRQVLALVDHLCLQLARALPRVARGNA